MARYDIVADERAIGKQFRGGSVLVRIGFRPTLVPKIRSRVTTSLVRELVKEGDIDNVDVWIGTEMAERLLIRSLALSSSSLDTSTDCV